MVYLSDVCQNYWYRWYRRFRNVILTINYYKFEKKTNKNRVKKITSYKIRDRQVERHRRGKISNNLYHNYCVNHGTFLFLLDVIYNIITKALCYSGQKERFI